VDRADANGKLPLFLGDLDKDLDKFVILSHAIVVVVREALHDVCGVLAGICAGA
jgi:hypothetical protein